MSYSFLFYNTYKTNVFLPLSVFSKVYKEVIDIWMIFTTLNKHYKFVKAYTYCLWWNIWLHIVSMDHCLSHYLRSQSYPCRVAVLGLIWRETMGESDVNIEPSCCDWGPMALCEVLSLAVLGEDRRYAVRCSQTTTGNRKCDDEGHHHSVSWRGRVIPVCWERKGGRTLRGL